jgi:hypothetical protein
MQAQPFICRQRGQTPRSDAEGLRTGKFIAVGDFLPGLQRGFDLGPGGDERGPIWVDRR